MDEKWVPKCYQKVMKIEPLGAHGYAFSNFVRFRKDVFFDEFSVRQKVGPKSQTSATLAANWIPLGYLVGVVGRGGVPGRRKSRG